jgi:hypothetical protein
MTTCVHDSFVARCPIVYPGFFDWQRVHVSAKQNLWTISKLKIRNDSGTSNMLLDLVAADLAQTGCDERGGLPLLEGELGN